MLSWPAYKICTEILNALIHVQTARTTIKTKIITTLNRENSLSEIERKTDILPFSLKISPRQFRKEDHNGKMESVKNIEVVTWRKERKKEKREYKKFKNDMK